MDKLDLVKQLGRVYRPPSDGAVLVDVPEMNFLMIEGIGDPNRPGFATATEALYGLSYGLKFAVKRGPSAVDYKVMPLEGLWWADDMDDFIANRRDGWRWQLMIAQPSLVTVDLLEQVRGDVAFKKKLPGLEVRLESFDEGSCAQILHVGPYSEEWPTVEKLHAFIAERGFVPRGKHHEIYVGDPRRAAPDKLKTIIRQPIAPM